MSLASSWLCCCQEQRKCRLGNTGPGAKTRGRAHQVRFNIRRDLLSILSSTTRHRQPRLISLLHLQPKCEIFTRAMDEDRRGGSAIHPVWFGLENVRWQGASTLTLLQLTRAFVSRKRLFPGLTCVQRCLLPLTQLKSSRLIEGGVGPTCVVKGPPRAVLFDTNVAQQSHSCYIYRVRSWVAHKCSGRSGFGLLICIANPAYGMLSWPCTFCILQGLT